MSNEISNENNGKEDNEGLQNDIKDFNVYYFSGYIISFDLVKKYIIKK